MTDHNPAAAAGLPSSEPVLIAPRRNFLIRALGFAAAGAAMSVPVLAIESPRDRLRHHLDGVAKAMGEIFPASRIEIGGNCRTIESQDLYRTLLAAGERESACVTVAARSLAWSLDDQLARIGGAHMTFRLTDDHVELGYKLRALLTVTQHALDHSDDLPEDTRTALVCSAVSILRDAIEISGSLINAIERAELTARHAAQGRAA